MLSKQNQPAPIRVKGIGTWEGNFQANWNHQRNVTLCYHRKKKVVPPTPGWCIFLGEHLGVRVCSFPFKPFPHVKLFTCFGPLVADNSAGYISKRGHLKNRIPTYQAFTIWSKIGPRNHFVTQLLWKTWPQGNSTSSSNWTAAKTCTWKRASFQKSNYWDVHGT